MSAYTNAVADLEAMALVQRAQQGHWGFGPDLDDLIDKMYDVGFTDNGDTFVKAVSDFKQSQFDGYAFR